ncbi:DUF1120 domain-containing protein [Apirhabdus apintestini]|uniref:DUF1120 domain-containing protein n=1 Tax=Erwinia sp. HR93 TaxID=3094840 RepID=UPI002ADEACF8|nr:DUF1120 domain-containing protein [Erwinia sp. HR93]MEA1065319.1 DUF1120 domain-containing protein [Erwinia sp. HR93]WPM84708.1 DUF1120 domain-containing protein [Enterobacteriaceae bacterium CA-0114]WPM85641.1 DUF1120 domain-containing protein [Enterobacteriaceae bacterium CA-0114]
MKMAKHILAASLLAVVGGQAMAADSVDVKVIGTIVPAACTPTLDGGAVVDYGTIKASTLAADDFTVLPVKSIPFSITCDAPAKASFHGIDAQSDSVVKPIGKQFSNPTKTVISASTSMSGLGLTDENAKIGAYTMWMAPGSVSLDGSTDAVDSLYSNSVPTQATVWSKADTNGAVIGTNKYYTWAKAGELVPVAFTTMKGELSVQAAINKASELDLTKAVHLNGQTTLEIYYL